jgi:saccharopine dehydrogenase-like NADP-dependent oxidoreductase
MRKVLLLGAGKSSSYLIDFFINVSERENLKLIVTDFSEEEAKKKIRNNPAAVAIGLDINNSSELQKVVSDADIVISLLPANLHFPVALECLKQKKNLVTASYVSPQMEDISEQVSKTGLIFLNECGLDPGIDHMSAMKIINEIKTKGGEILSFRSYTGGLVAPESNDNPWGYKFSWNPRNVILAGQGTAKYIENGKYKYLPYQRLFEEVEKITVDGFGSFDGYANRDSLSYRKLYHLEQIPTMIRGTLRQSGFCKAWNIFVKLGLTDDTYVIEDSEHLTYKKLVEAFLPESISNNLFERISEFTGCNLTSNELQMIEWTGILSDEIIGIENASPAKILQHLLEQKWKLEDSDKDMIVMQHQFEYLLDRKKVLNTSSLVVKGENSIYTAMSKTVGLPAAIAALLILNKKIELKGVQIPVQSSIYEPVLHELKKFQIDFKESSTMLA